MLSGVYLVGLDHHPRFMGTQLESRRPRELGQCLLAHAPARHFPTFFQGPFSSEVAELHFTLRSMGRIGRQLPETLPAWHPPWDHTMRQRLACPLHMEQQQLNPNYLPAFARKPKEFNHNLKPVNTG